MPTPTPRQGTDAAVDNRDVRLATTDFGGAGPAVVLMHGLGLTRRSLTRLAGHLSGWRVITMDLRGHGESTTARWGFDEAISDLDVVCRWYDLHSPYVAGHSLGGMVALRYACTGSQVAGAVNIDGWGPGLAHRYLGEDTDQVAGYLAAAAQGRLPTRLATSLTRRTRQWREGTTPEVLRLLHGADVIDWHAQAAVPTLAVCASAPSTRVERRLMGREYTRRQDAHHRGIRRDLDALAMRSRLVKVAHVDATHALCATHPADVAQAMDDFRTTVLAGASA